MHLWRVVGQNSDTSVFDVGSGAELHEILWNLPLFPFTTIAVIPLTEHPSALSANPRARAGAAGAAWGRPRRRRPPGAA
ncbi:muconolactone delta-isomerase [Geodermatophilus siccatus]|uniref:Muconolactone delta-isomerase n=1 Tax=Geodermatophilus siccatus TaxID=1137991 RepID=A0A1G9MP23_9ACTN|nr:muconolactone delta-isomerase [Geodermatophilus siccatus]